MMTKKSMQYVGLALFTLAVLVGFGVQTTQAATLRPQELVAVLNRFIDSGTVPQMETPFTGKMPQVKGIKIQNFGLREFIQMLPQITVKK